MNEAFGIYSKTPLIYRNFLLFFNTTKIELNQHKLKVLMEIFQKTDDNNNSQIAKYYCDEWILKSKLQINKSDMKVIFKKNLHILGGF